MYYGYNGYNGYNNGMYNTYPAYYGNTTGGYGPAFILVLFILLVIIFGVGFINNPQPIPNNNCCCNN